jgi:hypothetical protein
VENFQGPVSLLISTLLVPREEQYCKQDKAKALGSTEGFKDTSCRIEADLGKLPDPLRCELEAQVLINSPCSIKACL